MLEAGTIMAEVYMINIDEPISNDLYQRLYRCVSRERKDKINQYKFEADAKRCLYADILVRYLACDKLHIKNDKVYIENNKYGKPYLHHIKNQFFNISHSGKWVACGWSNQEIGIDIQKIEDIDLDIAKSFFCESEYLSVMNCEKTEQINSFYTLWTLKESYIKYKGNGLIIPLNSFQFNIMNEKISLQSEDIIKPMFYTMNIDEQHKLAICTLDSELSSINYLSVDSLRQLIN